MGAMWSRYELGDQVQLAGARGVIVAGGPAVGGEVSFETPGGSVGATVLRAAGPGVALGDAQVWLVQEESDEDEARYALMVDDAYWGVRVQPAAFAEAEIAETFVMGYRLGGLVLRDGEPVADANVSLELRLQTADDGEITAWDSEEYNELVYSTGLETWVEGPTIYAPIRTDEDGRWTVNVPKGDGALYQRYEDRRDGSSQSQGSAPRRYVSEVWAMHNGHRARAAEGLDAVVNMDSAGLLVRGTPGAWLRIGTMDSVGNAYEVPPSGEVEVGELPSCVHAVVQFMRNAWGAWDSRWGCPRVAVELEAGETTEAELAPLEEYPTDGSIVAGRVYERPGVPAVGVAIVAVDLETGEVVGTIATTDGGGFWSAEVPENGFGGDPFIHDATWGSLPVLGMPYSDVCLGARAYSSWLDEFRPEAWRKGSFGHKNFAYVPDSIWVEDAETGERFETVEAPYGGWVTDATLPKYRYVEDLQELLQQGPELRLYDLVDAEGVLETGFTLGSQPFEDWETPPGLFRATGYCPEAKLLLGGKVHGNVVVGGDERVDEEEPEAARFGLEFGSLSAYAETRLGPREQTLLVSGVAGMLCPYCGGPAHRDPGPGVAERGYCVQCADRFGVPHAMDCRSYFRSPTVGAGGPLEQRVVVLTKAGERSRRLRYHWRPDVYDETDAYLTQSGPGQATNAPRWFAKHLDAFGDGLGVARFDGDFSPPYRGGHPLSYFAGLPEIGRELGVVQLKAVLDPGYVLPTDIEVDVDCMREDESQETRRMVLDAGLRGPCEEAPFGDAVRLVTAAKAGAESCASPYQGVGLYVGVSDVRLVSPESAAGCRFTVVGDVPFLASPAGVPTRPRSSTPVALELSWVWGNPHLMTDVVGQVFLTYARDGDIVVHRRGGMSGEWDEGVVVPTEGASEYPWTAKDPRGTLVLVSERDASATEVLTSRDDARHMEG